MKNIYEVETYSLADGWSNTWTITASDGSESPEFFLTKKESEEAIKKEIKRTAEHIENGDIVKESALTMEDFRIVKKWAF
jgi:hypothetical protein